MPRGIAAINAIWRERQKAASRADEGTPHGAHPRDGYDPNQPRLPKGHPDGGQWTSGGYGPASTERVVVNTDGSTVRSEVNASDPSIPWDERHIVRLPNGHELTVENFGPTQTVYNGEGIPATQTVLTSDGPEPQEIAPVFVRGGRAFQRTLQRQGGGFPSDSAQVLLAIFAARSKYNNANGIEVLNLRAEDYRRGEEVPNVVIHEGQLTEKEVRDVCKRYEDTKRFLDEAVDEAHKEGSYAKGHRSLEPECIKHFTTRSWQRRTRTIERKSRLRRSAKKTRA